MSTKNHGIETLRKAGVPAPGNVDPNELAIRTVVAGDEQGGAIEVEPSLLALQKQYSMLQVIAEKLDSVIEELKNINEVY